MPCEQFSIGRPFCSIFRNRSCRRAIAIMRYGLAVLFLFSGATHNTDRRLFAISIQNYQLLPFDWAVLLAESLPKLEMLVGILLLVGVWVDSAFRIAAALLILFLIAVITALSRGLDISCGCFGNSSPAISWSHVVLLLVLLFGVILSILDRKVFARSAVK